MTKKSGWIIILAVISLVIIILGCGFLLLEKQPSVEETIPPETEEKTLFYENFENGSQNWNLEEGWALEKIDNNTILKGEGHRWARLKNRSWDNYAFEARFRLIQGTIHFNYRHSDDLDGPHRYFIGVRNDALYLKKQRGDKFYDLTEVPISLDSDWHEIEIRGYENFVNVYLNDKLFLAYKDEDPIIAGGIAFETLQKSDFLIEDVHIKRTNIEDIVTESIPELFVPDIIHTGDLIVGEGETMFIENKKYLQHGHIYINDRAKLILRNSQLAMGRGDKGDIVPTVHVYIFVLKGGSLEIENSIIFPTGIWGRNRPFAWIPGVDCLLCVRNNGKTTITNSPTAIHVFEMLEGALTMINSEMINEMEVFYRYSEEM